MNKYIIAAGILCLFSCDIFQPRAKEDKTPPKVTVTYPANNDDIPENITIKANASDNEGIRFVCFYVDGDSVSVDDTAPYEVFLSIAYYADGRRHTLYAEAVDRSGNRGQSELISVRILQGPGTVPLLTAPPVYSAVDHDSLIFQWRAVPDAVSYEIQISSTPDFLADTRQLSCPDTLIRPMRLVPGVYYWRVRAGNFAGLLTQWSQVWQVTVFDPFTMQSVLLDGPVQSSLFEKNAEVTFRWVEIAGAADYVLQVSSDIVFSNMVVNSECAGDASPAFRFDPGLYFWRVKARNVDGAWSQWSETRSFGIPDFSLFEGTEGLVAYYPLNGNAVDESPNGFHGTVHGARPCKDRFGNEDCAYQFFNDDYIDFGDVFNDINIPFSISLWVFCTQYPLGIFNSDCFYREGMSIYFGFWFQISNDGSLQVSYGDGGCAGVQCRRSRFSNEPVPLNRWIHVAASVNGSDDMKLYVNGLEVEGYYNGGGGELTHNQWRAFLSGYQGNGSKIDDVRIYNRAVGHH
jgi:hypothetical protein